MKKVWLVLLEREKAASLKELRRLGLIHLEPLSGMGKEFEEAGRRLAEVERAIGFLSSVKLKDAPERPATIEAGLEASAKAAELSETIRLAHEEAATLTKELERTADWGDFDPALAASLESTGYGLRLFETSPQSLSRIPEGLSYVRLSAPKGRARIALLSRDLPAVLGAEFQEFALPVEGPAALRTRIAAAGERARKAELELNALAAYVPALDSARAFLSQEKDFEAVRSGMAQDETLAYLGGYIPEKDLPKLTAVAKKHAWGLLTRDPEAEELPPSKVENGPLVRIVAPVFDFLGTVPNYREYDISGLFLFFFCFFFAMIFGDGGYGSLLLLAGVFAAYKSKKSSGKVADPVRLLLLLAGSTVAWGVMTGSWFGLPPEKLPGILRAIDVPWISNENPASGDNVKMLCFLIGTVQLVVAHLKNIKRDIGSLKFLGQVGQLAMVMGMLFLVLNLVISSERFPIPGWALYLVGGGFALNFIFGSYDGSAGVVKGIIGGIISSFANIVSVFLGVVNVFADIVSYIRLWAVGLAGLAISQTVNNMAGPMFGHFIMFFMGVILLGFGHGLNIVMSVLSVVVHGVRLNMLEFSGHLGMEWSGYKYEPFRATAPEDRQQLKGDMP